MNKVKSLIKEAAILSSEAALTSYRMSNRYAQNVQSTKRCIVFAVYRPPDSANLNSFFNELSNSVNLALEKYYNIIVFGDFNVDTQNEQHPDYNEFKSFSDVMGLQNLVKGKTCFTKNHASSIDVFLTNSAMALTVSFRSFGHSLSAHLLVHLIMCFPIIVVFA